MSRSRTALAFVAVLALASTQALRADVRSEEKTKFQLAGALGRVVNMFGGKAAREGVTSTTAVKGNRMMTTFGDSTGQIIDLAEEKVYDLDLKKKSYKVTTFAELRRQMEEAKKRAEEEAKKEQPQQAQQDPNAKQYDIDFDIKNTGEKKDVNGFSTSQSIMTITIREKGKTLEQSGGMVLTSDMWMTPAIPALKEVAEFRTKYFEKVYGTVFEGASPQDMASAMAMYPQLKPAMEKMAAEGKKLSGTPVSTTLTFDAVKSPEQMAAESNGSAGSDKSKDSAPPSVGGLAGRFAARMARKKDDDKAADGAAAGAKNRATVITSTMDVLKVTTTVSADEVAIPTGFKENK